MKVNRLLFPATALVLLSACAAQRKPLPPAPPPVARPAPTPAPAPPPPADWRDAAQTAGDWRYLPDMAGPTAAFGPAAGDALLALRCDRTAGQVVLRRAGAASGAVPLTVTTTSTTRSFTATPEAGPLPALSLALPARDPILDAMAFSRGRFMIEAPGLPPLYLPAWPEIGRVIEDCR